MKRFRTNEEKQTPNIRFEILLENVFLKLSASVHKQDSISGASKIDIF